MMTEAEKSPDLQSASWTTRRADVSAVGGQEKVDILTQRGRQEKFRLTQSFCSIQVFSGWHEAHLYQGGHLFYSVYPFKCYSHLKKKKKTNTLTDTE